MGTAVLAAVLPAAALAQIAVPPALEPARPGQNLEERVLPKAKPRITAPLVRDQAAPEDAARLSFTFRDLRIEGATALGAEALREAWAHQPGDVVTVQDVFLFANAVTRLYAEAGYALSFGVVPEQDIENGVVTIRVVEGFVDRIVYAGDDVEQGGAVHRRLQALAAPVLASRPLHMPELERALLLINDLPGLSAAATLSPAPDRLGGADLRIEVTKRPTLSTSADYNSFLPASLGRHSVGGTLLVNGFDGAAGQVRAGRWKSIASDDYWSVFAGLSTAVGHGGLRLGLSGRHSRTAPSDDLLASLSYEGKSSKASLWLDVPVVRTRARNLNVGLAASLTDTGSEILNDRLSSDRLRSLEASASYEFADATQAVTSVRLGVARGIDVMGATGNSRANGELTYTTALLDVQRRQPMFDLAGGTVSLQLDFRGQAAMGPGGLFSAAECAYGGRRYGRAYDAGDLSGDHCAMASLKAGWDRSLREGLGTGAYAFVDGGMVRQKGSLLAGDLRTRKASSGGIGLHTKWTDRVTGLVEVARQLTLSTDQGGDQDTRALLGITVNF